jgi:nicotinamide mononucleotide adenylyltransferase
VPFPAASIHGRFQVIHNDHVRYFRAAAEKYGRLYIGITGQAAYARYERARPVTSDHPLTYWERVLMWRAFLDSEGALVDHVVGPFPIERPELLTDFVPLSCVCATTVREEWNHEKIARLEAIGYRVDVLYQDLSKSISGALVREQIAEGDEAWEESVPGSVADYLRSIGTAERLRRGHP